MLTTALNRTYEPLAPDDRAASLRLGPYRAALSCASFDHLDRAARLRARAQSGGAWPRPAVPCEISTPVTGYQHPFGRSRGRHPASVAGGQPPTWTPTNNRADYRILSTEPLRAAVAGQVPHYSDTAAVTGSLIFVLILAALVVAAFVKRRR